MSKAASRVDKKKYRHLTGCPRCGSHWAKVSGFLRCSSSKCGHVHGSNVVPAAMDDRASYVTGRVDNLIAEDVPERHTAPTPSGRRDQPLNLKDRR